MVNAVHQEVDGQGRLMIGQECVDMEQEAMEDVLQEGPHEVAEEERRHGIQESSRDDATQNQRLEGCSRVDGERRERVCAQRKLDQGTDEDVRSNWQPHHRHDVPRSTREHLEHM